MKRLAARFGGSVTTLAFCETAILQKRMSDQAEHPVHFLLQAFDDLLLLKSGGNVIYHGSLGKRSSRLIKYFEAGPSCMSHPHTQGTKHVE